MIGRDTFSAVAPVLGPQQKNWVGLYVTLFHFFNGGQHDTKYVTFELLLLYAAIVADEILGFMLEPARTYQVPVIRRKGRSKSREQAPGVYKVMASKNNKQSCRRAAGIEGKIRAPRPGLVLTTSANTQPHNG